MEKFIAHHAAQVSCTLSGFDRLVFRGTLLPLMPDHAMFHFLTRAGVRLLDFKDYVSQTSERVKAAALAEAEKQQRPVEYLESPKTSKEAFVERQKRITLDSDEYYLHLLSAWPSSVASARPVAKSHTLSVLSDQTTPKPRAGRPGSPRPRPQWRRGLPALFDAMSRFIPAYRDRTALARQRRPRDRACRLGYLDLRGAGSVHHPTRRHRASRSTDIALPLKEDTLQT